MRTATFALSLSLVCAAAAAADAPAGFDAAAAFGARPSVSDLRLSPDGRSVAYIAPAKGQGAVLYTMVLDATAKPRIALTVDGAPNRLEGCNWVASDRLICEIYGIVRNPDLLPFTRLVAVNADGTNPKLLSSHQSEVSQFYGGDVIDWLPQSNGSVLMTQYKRNDAQLGTRFGSEEHGLRVDRVDTRTLAAAAVEPPTAKAEDYLSDGNGIVRIMATGNVRGATGQAAGSATYLYRRKGSRQWETLGSYDFVARTGFHPLVIDADHDVVYGFKKKDGRLAVYTVSLDGNLEETLVYANDTVDVDHLLWAGRRERVVGVSYSTDYREDIYFDPAVDGLIKSLTAALKARPGLVDSSLDQNKMLFAVGKDDDPGVYYLFDRAAKRLETFLVVRSQLEGIKLANVRPVTYPARDGTQVPGYLTLPPGRETAKDLPAIVMPHGGPGARDHWGFDWLAQYYAARGYAVLQPNFRGSTGYGDAWFQKNGFQSWPTAIGDIVDGGKWLVSEHIADPAKLGIVGWSYGGYAALQSAVVEPTLFKAVVAIAPVTDLNAMKEDHRYYTNFYLVQEMIGTGPHVREGSPAANAAKIKAPVLLVHGNFDRNVDYTQSQIMDRALAAAGVRHELLSFEGLDHYLDDSEARTTLLRRSDAWLREAFGL